MSGHGNQDSDYLLGRHLEPMPDTRAPAGGSEPTDRQVEIAIKAFSTWHPDKRPRERIRDALRAVFALASAPAGVMGGPVGAPVAAPLPLTDERIDAIQGETHNPQDTPWANWRRFARAIERECRSGITRLSSEGESGGGKPT